MSSQGVEVEPACLAITNDARRQAHGLREQILARSRAILGFLLRFTGVSWIIRRFVSRNRATILVYHDPSPEVFDKHLAYLASRYTFVPLGKLLEAIQNHDWSGMPANPLAVTIDDGHRGNYRLLESIRRWNIRPTIYLCSMIVNTQRRFWWRTGYPGSKELTSLPHQDFLDVLRRKTGYEPAMEYSDRQSLDLSELREMEPYVDFGLHTRFHPILINCSAKTCREEIVQSKQDLESLLGRQLSDFSYPNGDYTDREKHFVGQANYRSARTVDIGWSNLSSDPLQLRAMPIDDDASINVLCGQASGIFGYIHSWLQRARQMASRKKQDKVRVLMLGTEPREGGGMGTVVQHFLDYDFMGAGVQMRFLPNDHGVSVLRKVTYFLRAALGLAIGGLWRRIDVVHIHSCSGRSFLRASVCILIARVLRIPIVIHIHGGGFPQYLRRFRSTKLALLNCCTAILVVNDHLLAMLDHEPLRGRVRVLYNMLPEPSNNRRQAHDHDRTPALARILFLGRFDPLKGCMELLEAFREIHSKYPDVRLIMAGNGRNWEEASRFVKNERLQEAVVLPGWIEGEAKQRLLDQADIMVLPSSCEAFPMVILEAMQRAMPVVTAARPGVETQVTDHVTGIIAQSPAPEHLTTALLELIETPRLRRQYGDAGRRRFLDCFTSDVIGPQLIEIYRCCLAMSRTASFPDPTNRCVCKPFESMPTGGSTCNDT